MTKLVDKTVNFDLTSVDSNAFNLLANFRKQARREGWTKKEIDKVTEKATEGDYDNLVATLQDHCDVTEEEI